MADTKTIVATVRVGVDGGTDPMTKSKKTKWFEPGTPVTLSTADADFLIARKRAKEHVAMVPATPVK